MDVLSLMSNHRTIRKYKEKLIDDALLESLLNAGCRASTTGNMQVYSIVVTRNNEIKTQLSPCHFNQSMIKEAPVVLTFCADFNRFNQWCVLRNAKPGYDNFLSFMTAAIDALLVAQNVCLAAESKGLGICYLGTTLYTADKIIDILKLPQGVIPITTVTMGYPADDSVPVDRLPLEGVIHYETYQNYTPDSINDIYQEKEGLSSNASFVRDNQKETLAQVFTDIRYKKDDNLNFSRILLDVLKKQGFMNQ